MMNRVVTASGKKGEIELGMNEWSEEPNLVEIDQLQALKHSPRSSLGPKE